MKMKIYFMLFIGLLLISSASAETDSLGTKEQGKCVNLIQTCSNCTYVNITSVIYPNSTIALGEAEMTKSGTYYNYSFCETDQIGIYLVTGVGDLDGEDVVWNYVFTITPSGNTFDSSQSIIYLGSLIVMLILSVGLFFLAVKSESSLAKITFYTLSVITFIMVILYSVVSIQQTLFGFTAIITGIETFWFVVKMGLSVGILAFGVIVFLVLLKAWKVKRGLVDYD